MLFTWRVISHLNYHRSWLSHHEKMDGKLLVNKDITNYLFAFYPMFICNWFMDILYHWGKWRIWQYRWTILEFKNYLDNIKWTLESKKTLFCVYLNVLVPYTEILYMIQILMHGNIFHLTFLEDTPTSCNQIYCILRYKIKHKTDSLRVCSSLQWYRSFIILFISKLHRNFDSHCLR